MTIDEQLLKFDRFNVGLNLCEGTLIISMEYPKEWKIPEPEGDKIKMFKEDGKYFYCTAIENGTDGLFGLINETIGFNEEMELKAQLFKSKIDELSQIFIREPLEMLETLEFKMKKRKGATRNGGKQPQQPETVAENDGDTTSADSDDGTDGASDIDSRIEAAMSEKEQTENI